MNTSEDISKAQLISMIHFLEKRDEASKKENLELKELIKELQETHNQKVNTQTDLLASIERFLKDKNDEDLKPRARQNVVFEHGFMCAHLGRTHVCALLDDRVEQPGDLKGVIYKPLDAAGAWKYLIADEMKVVGLAVDKNNIS